MIQLEFRIIISVMENSNKPWQCYLVVDGMSVIVLNSVIQIYCTLLNNRVVDNGNKTEVLNSFSTFSRNECPI